MQKRKLLVLDNVPVQRLGHRTRDFIIANKYMNVSKYLIDKLFDIIDNRHLPTSKGRGRTKVRETLFYL